MAVSNISHQVQEEAWDKVADDYYSEVISPLKHSINQPIQKFVEGHSTKNKTAIDIGCGTGGLLEYIAPLFKEIHALDISQAMLDQAKQNIEKLQPEHAQKVQYHKKNMAYLKVPAEPYDYVFAINSLINGKFSNLKRSFNNIPKLLAKKGIFVGVFPALESIQKEYRLTFEHHLKQFESESMALAKTKKDMEAERISTMLGLYNTGDMAQKYYTQYELRELLESAGLKIKKISKVKYDKEHSYNYGEKSHSTMWDWFIVASL